MLFLHLIRDIEYNYLHIQVIQYTDLMHHVATCKLKTLVKLVVSGTVLGFAIPSPFQIIVHFSIVLSQASLTLIKFLEKYINIYKFKQMHNQGIFHGKCNETNLIL